MRASPTPLSFSSFLRLAVALVSADAEIETTKLDRPRGTLFPARSIGPTGGRRKRPPTQTSEIAGVVDRRLD